MNTIKNVELNKKEKIMIILKNTLNMLTRRKKIKINDLESQLEPIYSSMNNNNIIIMDSIVPDEKIGIIFAPHNISTIKKTIFFENFLKDNDQVYKIVIINNINKKVLKQILSFNNIEIWWEYELLEDILKKTIIPQHDVLSDQDKEIFLQNFKPTELSVIFSTDMMARYYKMKIGDIVRIIRPSNTSGNSIFYRIVKPGPLSLLL